MRVQPVFKVLQLLNKAGFDLELWPAGVQKFKRFNHGPAILAHQVDSEYARSTRLALHRVNEHRFAFASGLLNKIVNLTGCLVLLVKQNLVLIVLPKEGQVHDPYRLPEVPDLLPTAVHNVCDFVCHHKFQILHTRLLQGNKTYLRGELVPNKEPIFDLDRTDHVIWDHDHLLLLLHHHGWMVHRGSILLWRLLLPWHGHWLHKLCKLLLLLRLRLSTPAFRFFNLPKISCSHTYHPLLVLSYRECVCRVEPPLRSLNILINSH